MMPSPSRAIMGPSGRSALALVALVVAALLGSGCIHRTAVYFVVENRTADSQAGDLWVRNAQNETIFHHRFANVTPLSESGRMYTAEGGRIETKSGTHWIHAEVGGLILNERRDVGTSTTSIVLVIETGSLTLYQVE